MQPTYQTRAKAKLIATLAAIIVIGGIVLLADHFKSETDSSTANLSGTTTQTTTASDGSTATTTDTAAAPTTSTSASSSAAKDGTYSASSDYYVPHGSEAIQVTLTIKDGVVTSSSITNSEGDHDSAQYQEDFASAYTSYVVGKKISGLQLGTVAGASDTTQGFNDALNQIAAKAQA